MTADVTLRPAARPGRRGLRVLLPAALAIGLGLSLAGCKTTEEKANEYYQSGLDLLAQGDVDRAIVQFRNVFDIQGTHYDARKKLAEVLAEQGRQREAYSQYLRLAEQYPDDLATRIALARMAFEGGQGEEFDRHAARAIELAPQDPDVQALDLARRYRDATVDDTAARNDIAAKAGTLAQTRPDDPLLLGILLDKAARDNDLKGAEPLVNTLITLQPENRLRYQQRLALLMELGDMAAVEAHLRDTIARFPDDTSAKADLVRFYMSQKQVDKAETYLRELADAAPADDATARVDLLRFIEAQKGTQAARVELERFIAAGGDPLIFQVLRAGFDFRDGKRNEAIAEIRKVLEGATPSDQTRRVHVQLARMLLETGDQAAAWQEVDTVLAEDPAQPGALKLKAMRNIQGDDTDNAILALRGVLDQTPEDAEAMGLMADAYTRAGEADLARDYLAQAAKASGNAPAETLRFAGLLFQEGRYRPAEDALLPALQQAPDNLELLGLLGQTYLAMPDMPRAQDVIRRLREIGSDQAKGIADQLELARLNSQDGQNAAMDYLEQLAGAENAGIGPRMGLIRARLMSGDPEGARQIARDLAAAQPDNRSAQLTLAMTEIAAGDMTTGRTLLDKLIAENPADTAPYMALARIATQQGETEAVTKVIDEGLAKMPDNPDLLWIKAGLVERGGDVEGAIAIYERLYAQNSGSVVIANNLASLLSTWHADDPEKVARASVVARRLKDTTVPAFMDTYGWIQHLNGDSEAALPYLQGAATALSEDAMVQLHLGLVLNAVGQTDPAREQLKKGLDMLAPGLQAQTITRAREVLAQLDGGTPASPDAAPAADDGDAAPAPLNEAPAAGTQGATKAADGESSDASATEETPAGAPSN